MRAHGRPSPTWRPIPAVLAGCYLLAAAGCGPGWDDVAYPTSTPKIDPSIFEPGDPNRVQVKSARLRSTPAGCEVDVTFTNVSDKTLSAGFDVDMLDAGGHRVASRSTAVQQAAPGDTKVVSSDDTTAGPSGVKCPAGGQARVTKVSVFNF
jgi:hypothetical protein